MKFWIALAIQEPPEQPTECECRANGHSIVMPPFGGRMAAAEARNGPGVGSKRVRSRAQRGGGGGRPRRRSLLAGADHAQQPCHAGRSLAGQTLLLGVRRRRHT